HTTPGPLMRVCQSESWLGLVQAVLAVVPPCAETGVGVQGRASPRPGSAAPAVAALEMMKSRRRIVDIRAFLRNSGRPGRSYVTEHSRKMIRRFAGQLREQYRKPPRLVAMSPSADMARRIHAAESCVSVSV